MRYRSQPVRRATAASSTAPATATRRARMARPVAR
jgi:hypothetical protein